MVVNQFDTVAPYYDMLSRLVFGKEIMKSQLSTLDKVKRNDHVLIVGGGTGKILSGIPGLTTVDYVEGSKVMIRKAQSVPTECNTSFFHKDFFLFKPTSKYDVIICPFFLDCFNQLHLLEAIQKLKSLMKPDGILLISDFELKNLNRTLSRLMHLFFSIFTGLESKYLKPIHNHVLTGGFELLEENFFYQKMIFSRVYRNL